MVKLLAELVQYLEIRDLLTLRQVNSASDRLSTWRLRRIGTPVKDLKSDEDIDKFRADTANAPHPLPFSAFSLDLTTISMDGIDKFLELQDAIRSLSIVHNPEEQDGITGEWIRQIYTENMVGAKLGRVLTALAHTLRTLRLKFFADVTLGGDEESSLFPLELPALETLEAVYFQPNRELGGDLVGHLANCAENLDHLAIHRHHDHTVNFTENLNERIPGLLFGRERSIPPSLSLDTNIRIADLPILQLLNQRGYNRIRKLNLGLFAYHLCQEVAPTIYGNFLQRLSDLLSLQAASLEDLLLVTDHVDTVQERGSTDQIQLPLVMKKLQRIALYFPQKEAGVASPIASFTAGQFPQLAHVDLGFDHGWFNGRVFPTVTSLEVNYESELSDHRVIFPSLKRLLFYAQDPSTVVGDILKRDGGRVEVLGCFGLGNRITSLQHKAALARFSKSTLGDLNARVPDEHILGNFFGIVSQHYEMGGNCLVVLTLF